LHWLGTRSEEAQRQLNREVRIARQRTIGKREENGTEIEGVELPWRHH